MKLYLRALAERLDEKFGWPNLADFLEVVAYTESRFNAEAINAEGGSNAARGLFGLRPQSGLVSPLSPAKPNALLDPKIAVAAAADYAWRLRSYRAKGTRADDLTAGDIRRGWALPSLVADRSWAKERSKGVRERMLDAQAATDIDIIDRPLFYSGQQWPGLAAALSVLDSVPPPEKRAEAWRYVTLGGLQTLDSVVGGASLNDDVPIVVALHGRGGDAVGLANSLTDFSQPLRILLPNAPTFFGASKTQRAWWQQATASVAPAKMAELMGPARKTIAPMLSAVQSNYGRRPAIFGHSQGAMLAYLIASSAPTSADFVAPVSGWLPPQLWPAPGPSYPQIFAVHGANDTTIRPALDIDTQRAFISAGARANISVIPGAGHELDKLWPLARSAIEAWASEVRR